MKIDFAYMELFVRKRLGVLRAQPKINDRLRNKIARQRPLIQNLFSSYFM